MAFPLVRGGEMSARARKNFAVGMLVTPCKRQRVPLLTGLDDDGDLVRLFRSIVQLEQGAVALVISTPYIIMRMGRAWEVQAVVTSRGLALVTQGVSRKLKPLR